MNKFARFLIATLLFSINIGVHSEQTVNDAAAAVRQVMDQLFETYNRGDLDGHIALFAQNAIELPPNQPVVMGRDNIHERKKAGMKKADAVLNARIDELVVSGDWAFVRMTGTGKITLKDGPIITPDDKAILIWKRQADGSWKLTHDIWNSNLPAVSKLN